ncbi:hypothetical protein Tco_1437706 [Tanacetum coccineum]
MSTQQDIYVAGFENRAPMLNKDNYVPWSSRLLPYAKSKPNKKLIYNSIIYGPYVRRMIPEPSDPDRKVLNVGNQNGLNVVLRIANQNANQNGNGNVVASRAEAEEFDLMAAAWDLDEIEDVNANCILMANLQAQQRHRYVNKLNSPLCLNRSAEVHEYDNCYNNEIFNMFTQEEQYTELLDPIIEPHQTDDELTDKEVKHMEADDQAIQAILMGLPEDIYAAIDSCETA